MFFFFKFFRVFDPTLPHFAVLSSSFSRRTESTDSLVVKKKHFFMPAVGRKARSEREFKVKLKKIKEKKKMLTNTLTLKESYFSVILLEYTIYVVNTKNQPTQVMWIRYRLTALFRSLYHCSVVANWRRAQSAMHGIRLNSLERKNWVWWWFLLEAANTERKVKELNEKENLKRLRCCYVVRGERRNVMTKTTAVKWAEHLRNVTYTARGCGDISGIRWIFFLVLSAYRMVTVRWISSLRFSSERQQDISVQLNMIFGCSSIKRQREFQLST